jgi:hypothetical protein|tara:strand:- start:19 stop:303 length:285 start_codon:yes stop_codon:yes gene_type:complete
MNPSICKRISRQTDVVLCQWLKTLVTEEEQSKINTSNVRDFIPPSAYFYIGRTLRLNFYSPKWVRKTIKKLVKLGHTVEDVNMELLERVIPHRN